MSLKKIFCSLVSVGVIFASMGGIARAVPMELILFEKSFREGTIVSEHIKKLKEFIKEEADKVMWDRKTPMCDLLHIDSTAFGIFCCFCYKNNFTEYIKYATRKRMLLEHMEDMKVMQERPSKLKELYERFGIVDMSDDEISQVVGFIKSTYIS